MSSLQRIEINGRPATVAFLTAIGGRLVDAADASVAIANFDDGKTAYFTVKKLRGAAARKETAIHTAADDHLNKMKLAINYAFMKGRKAIDKTALKSAKTQQEAMAAMDGVPAAVKAALLEVLPKVLHTTLVAGGHAGVEIAKLRTAGEGEGHDFHGNQWIGDGSGQITDKAGKKYDVTFDPATRSYTVKEHDSPRGVSVGGATMKRNYTAVMSVNVHQEHQHKGIATALYKHIEAHLGRKLVPNWALTPEGEALWKSRAAADPPSLKMTFDANNPDAVDWADKHAGELIDGITETTRQDIADAIATALEEGDLGDAYQTILDAVGDPARAELIARTETMTAANEGQRQSWDQAVSAGLLTGDEQIQWITAEGACPLCDELDGETRDIDGQYPGDGGDGPPLHPNCRCTEGISG